MANDGPENFQEMLRAIAREVGQAADRLSEFDPEEMARSFGLDPESVRHWVDEAGRWIRSQSEGVPPWWSSTPGSGPDAAPDAWRDAGGPDDPRGSDDASAPPGAGSRARTGRTDDPLRSAGPHPLDLPTADQGTALAALDSGRWTVEPGTEALAGRGDGPGPSDSLGLVRELRARDWISADGELTLAGRNALARWLDASSRG